MTPLVGNFTNILKPCSGCGKDLSDPIYDHFWKSKEENAIHSEQADSNRSGESRGSTGENETR
jgi:hypothetical protein